MRNIVILISGSGSNMAAIVRAAEQGRWAAALNARVAAVLSNRADAQGLALPRITALPPPCWTTRPLPAAKRLMRP
jgi:folate-dependent phosphoribosylglycinamide formyltransferase PurN